MAHQFETKCLSPTGENLTLAAHLLQKGELVAFPTETVYGLGADALNEEAVKKIFIAKQRPMDNPLIVHVAKEEDIHPLCHVNPLAKKLMAAFWPGPLTLLLPKKEIVPAVTTGGLKTVALRMPNHPVALSLIEKSGCPIAAPSANQSGKPSPTKAEHVFEDMEGRIPLVIDGGASDIGVESTVLDISNDLPQILRPGGITLEMLLPYCKDITINQSVLAPLNKDEPALSPGMRYKHYAPAGTLTMVEGSEENVIDCCKKLYDEAANDDKKTAIFAFSEHIQSYGQRRIIDLGSKKQPEQAAARLFDILREMDHQHIEIMFSEVLPAEGIGLAVMNRLGRAAAFRKIQLD